MKPVEYLRLLQNNAEIKIGPPEREILEHRSRQYGISVEEYLRITGKNNLYSVEGQGKYFDENVIAPFLAVLPGEVSKVLKDIHVGILPTYNPNASTIRVPGDGPLIVLHTELLSAISFYNELQAIVGKQLESGPIEIGKNLLYSGHRVIVEYFKQIRKANYPTLPDTLSPGELDRVQYKTLANELFIIAHEFAHAYLGHLGTMGTRALSFTGETQKVDVYNTNQQMELDADVQAVRWLIQIGSSGVKQGALLFPSCSIGMTIEVLMLIHTVEVNTPKKDIRISSHPTAITRLQNILNNCSLTLNKLDKEFIEDLVSDASDTQSFLV